MSSMGREHEKIISVKNQIDFNRPPSDGTCTSPNSCIHGGYCQEVAGLAWNPSLYKKSICSHPQAVRARKLAESTERDN